MSLTDGAVAKSLGKAGGKALQQECTGYITSNGSVQYGQVAVTSGGSIPCKCIVHAVGENYNSSKPQDSEKVYLLIHMYITSIVSMYTILTLSIGHGRH